MVRRLALRRLPWRREPYLLQLHLPASLLDNARALLAEESGTAGGSAAGAEAGLAVGSPGSAAAAAGTRRAAAASMPLPSGAPPPEEGPGALQKPQTSLKTSYAVACREQAHGGLGSAEANAEQEQAEDRAHDSGAEGAGASKSGSGSEDEGGVWEVGVELCDGGALEGTLQRLLSEPIQPPPDEPQAAAEPSAPEPPPRPLVGSLVSAAQGDPGPAPNEGPHAAVAAQPPGPSAGAWPVAVQPAAALEPQAGVCVVTDMSSSSDSDGVEADATEDAALHGCAPSRAPGSRPPSSAGLAGPGRAARPARRLPWWLPAQQHRLQRWFGLRAFLLLQPASYTRRILDPAEAHSLLGAAALALAPPAGLAPAPAPVQVHAAAPAAAVQEGAEGRGEGAGVRLSQANWSARLRPYATGGGLRGLTGVPLLLPLADGLRDAAAGVALAPGLGLLALRSDAMATSAPPLRLTALGQQVRPVTRRRSATATACARPPALPGAHPHHHSGPPGPPPHLPALQLRALGEALGPLEPATAAALSRAAEAAEAEEGEASRRAVRRRRCCGLAGGQLCRWRVTQLHRGRPCAERGSPCGPRRRCAQRPLGCRLLLRAAQAVAPPGRGAEAEGRHGPGAGPPARRSWRRWRPGGHTAEGG
jgi:hypothetical protein